MIIIAMLFIVSPIEASMSATITLEQGYTSKKKETSTAGNAKLKAGPPFKSCKEALRAGYSHMRRGQPGYSSNLDRDNDGVACDKVK
jgi:hypothetical protein